MRIKEAIELYNWRASQDEKLSEMSQARLGAEVFPERDRNKSSVAISNLVNKVTKSVSIEKLSVMSSALGVDPNFLFGFNSIHDKDFCSMLNDHKKDE